MEVAKPATAGDKDWLRLLGDLAQQQGTAIELVVGTVLPKQTIEGEIEVRFTDRPVFGQLNSLSQVLFVDT